MKVLRNKNILLCFVLVLLCLLSAGCNKRQVQASEEVNRPPVKEIENEQEETTKLVTDNYAQYDFHGIPFLYPTYWEVKEDENRTIIRDSEDSFPYVIALYQGDTSQNTRDDIFEHLDAFFQNDMEKIIDKQAVYPEYRDEWEMCVITTYLNEDDIGKIYQTYAAVLKAEDGYDEEDEQKKERYDIVVIYHADSQAEKSVAGKIIDSIGKI